ncbi:hypothetical protein GCM10014715_24190 [Streptomyces spiralis]|uniref:Uncharacterized protein n=1 Tax=Streptomyces spiralis TaxID=66376 RepID=A0A918ZUZ9_9ACTN|nr:hypothetical protein [Streptomyces spiralis]GHE69466.1 hypothetical protein GCM10014715_24190 [Streptomyces spiralis]
MPWGASTGRSWAGDSRRNHQAAPLVVALISQLGCLGAEPSIASLHRALAEAEATGAPAGPEIIRPAPTDRRGMPRRGLPAARPETGHGRDLLVIKTVVSAEGELASR